MCTEFSHSIFSQLNESACDYYEISQFITNKNDGNDVLMLNCCWGDSSPHNILFRLRFTEVVFVSCPIGIHNPRFRIGNHNDLTKVSQLFDYSELGEQRNLFCIETNLADCTDHFSDHVEFQPFTYYVLAQGVEIEKCRRR